MVNLDQGFGEFGVLLVDTQLDVQLSGVEPALLHHDGAGDLAVLLDRHLLRGVEEDLFPVGRLVEGVYGQEGVYWW